MQRPSCCGVRSITQRWSALQQNSQTIAAFHPMTRKLSLISGSQSSDFSQMEKTGSWQLSLSVDQKWVGATVNIAGGYIFLSLSFRSDVTTLVSLLTTKIKIFAHRSYFRLQLRSTYSFYRLFALIKFEYFLCCHKCNWKRTLRVLLSAAVKKRRHIKEVA